MDFEAYLISKRIDSARFRSAEPDLWQSWRVDFEQMHPNSFTVQKLNLINPIRRKYQLAVTETPKRVTPAVAQQPASPIAKAAVKVSRPGMPKVTPPGMEPTATATVTAASDTNTPDAATSSAESPQASAKSESTAVPDDSVPALKPAKPVIPRPVIKPKPKTN